jgi:hypothetical protein
MAFNVQLYSPSKLKRGFFCFKVMPCIICGVHEQDAPIEHIVSESLGNETYVLTKGNLCRKHNTMFSEFESKALGKTILGMERARLAVETKKGKPASSKTGTIEFKGDQGFRENFITVLGLTEADIQDFNPTTGVFKIRVPAFDKTEVPTSKLLLKMGLESLSQSKTVIYSSYNFDQARQYLDKQTNHDWPFLVTENKASGFLVIPETTHQQELSNARCELLMQEANEETLLFNFVYGGVSMLINLIDRDVDWVKRFLEVAGRAELYPVHFRKKAGINR